MAIGATSRIALLIDDEPEYLGWVVEYLSSVEIQSEFSTSLNEALTSIQEKNYRLMLVDMNIPAEGAAAALAKNAVQQKYPGIIAAVKARSRGYGAHQVIAYTVHDDDAADAELAKLNCRYVLKGRPEALKAVIQASLRPHPPSRTPKPPARRRLPRGGRHLTGINQ